MLTQRKEDLSYLVTLQGRPVTSGPRLQETGRPANYPKKELYVCWGKAASNTSWM